MYPSPLNGVPAGTLLGGRAGRLFAALGVVLGEEGIPGVFAGDGVKGVENGWAAEVEVAAGGLSGWRSLEVVVRVRRLVERGNGCDRRWIQRWQIIMYKLWIGNDDFVVGWHVDAKRSHTKAYSNATVLSYRLEAFDLSDNRCKIRNARKTLSQCKLNSRFSWSP